MAPLGGVRPRPAPAALQPRAPGRAPRPAPALQRCGAQRGGPCAALAGGVRPWRTEDARLVLKDGSVFTGVSFGAKGTRVGEVVFNTSLTGYQEIMTDPSYAGQMVCFTAAHLGNTGTNAADDESAKAWLDGAIVRSLSPLVSSYRSEASLSAFCEAQGVVGISEVDTRALTRRLRDTGAMPGVICTDPGVSDAALVAQLGGWTLDGKDMASMVSTQQPYSWTQPTDAEWGFGPDLQPPRPGPRFRVVAYDFGVKRNILRRLASHGCDVVVVPCGTSAAEVLALSPDGVFLSNGPGDPQALPYAVASARALLGAVPLFGICMGHQLLGMALGGRTYKMKFGHHGGNHPIRFESGRIEISAQNHNYCVDPASLPPGVRVTHVNLNDGSCAGFVEPGLRVMGIQYHPEAAPGPHDADVNFEAFTAWMQAAQAERNSSA